MSRGGNGELYHHDDQFLRDRVADFPFHDDVLSPFFSQRPGDGSGAVHSQAAASPFLSFADYLQGSADYGVLAKGFDVPCSPPLDALRPAHGGAPAKGELVADANTNANTNVNASSTGGGDRGSVTPVTPNSSVSSSSTEAAGEDDPGPCKKDQVKQEEDEKPPGKGSDEGGDKSKKVNKTRKTGEKRQREARFAFMTKSEVDHLEDGYRWRKYGQKAVKNSPYPRSYYRCTTQKCSVKKRVERSYQDPTIVITTYEGQHTHQSPATIRGSTHILAPPPQMPASFHQELMMQQLPPLSANNQPHGDPNPIMYLPSLPLPLQQLQFPDYGLLQDIVPSFIHNNQP